MRQEFAPIECSFAAFHSLNETIFLGKVTRYNILHNFTRVAAVFVGALREAGLEIGTKVDFHVFNDTLKKGGKQCDGLVCSRPRCLRLLQQFARLGDELSHLERFYKVGNRIFLEEGAGVALIDSVRECE